MGIKCVVPFCRGGYLATDPQPAIEQKRSVFRFPSNEDLKRRWIAAIPRKNQRVSNYQGVCERHFRETDFVTQTKDSNKTRKEKQFQNSQDLQRKRLIKGAIPSVFPDCTAHLTKELPEPRGTVNATSGQRLASYNESLQKRVDQFLAEDVIKDFESLRNGLSNQIFPSKVSHQIFEEKLLFYEVSSFIENLYMSYSSDRVFVNFEDV